MEQQVLEFQLQKKTDTPIVHTKVRKRTIKKKSETQHFWEKPFYSFDMNRKNLADYFHRLRSLKHLAETNRKLATKLTSAYAES